MSEFVPAAPGTWTVIARVEATHEAAHALAALLLDVPLHEGRIDNPDAGVLGHVVTDKAGEAWKAMCVSLAPLIVTNRCPKWPLNLQSDDKDEFKAAVAAYDGGLTEDDFEKSVAIISELFALPSSKRSLTALGRALLDHGALSGEEIRRVVAEAKVCQ